LTRSRKPADSKCVGAMLPADEAQARAFLLQCRPRVDVTKVGAPTMSGIQKRLARARRSSLGPDGIPYQEWLSAEDAGLGAFF
jgi:hypothetical protein